MKGLAVIIFLFGSVSGTIIYIAEESLRLHRVHVPHYKFAGDKAHLECDFELGKTSLYSVKWYKDDEEFYRYLPRYNPSISTHSVDGVNVDVSRSDQKNVKLLNLDLRSTGVYRCEVSAEAPKFHSRHGEGRMTVVHLPKEDPQITGNLQDDYQIGDVLDLNCTSSKSFPPAKISFYINDQLVGIPNLDLDTNSLLSNEGFPDNGGVSRPQFVNSLTTSTLRLRLRLSASHFDSGGNAKVRCVATVSTQDFGDERMYGSSLSRKVASNEIDDFRFGSTSSRHHHSDDNTRVFPSQDPYVSHRYAFLTVRGGSSSLRASQQMQLVSKVPLLILAWLPWVIRQL